MKLEYCLLTQEWKKSLCPIILDSHVMWIINPCWCWPCCLILLHIGFNDILTNGSVTGQGAKAGERKRATINTTFHRDISWISLKYCFQYFLKHEWYICFGGWASRAIFFVLTNCCRFVGLPHWQPNNMSYQKKTKYLSVSFLSNSLQMIFVPSVPLSEGLLWIKCLCDICLTLTPGLFKFSSNFLYRLRGKC